MPFSDAMLLVGPIMKKLTMLGIIGSAALLTAVPFTSKKENRRQPWVKITTTQRAPQERPSPRQRKYLRFHREREFHQ
jgi:hypothetical protein